jgi:hypothetical protein
MDLRSLTRRIEAIAERVPEPTQPLVLVCVSRREPVDQPDDETNWHYETDAELDELKARFDHLYGGRTAPALFVHFVDPQRQP